MHCYLCNESIFLNRTGQVRDNPSLTIVECQKCGLVTLSNFEHILERHYEEGKMHNGEISISDWLLETNKDDQRRFDMLKFKMQGKSVLDFGCGNAGFILKSRNYAKDIEGVELEEQFQYFFAENKVKVWPSLIELKKKSKITYDLITAFHVFEHLIDPIKTLRELVELVSENGEIIIEVPSSDDALLTLYDNQNFSNFTYWSQHTFLFNQNTISLLVQKAGLKLNWQKQIQRYSLSNHLYWLAKGKPGGQKVWSFFDNEELDSAYAMQLSSIGRCDTIMASISF